MKNPRSLFKALCVLMLGALCALSAFAGHVPTAIASGALASVATFGWMQPVSLAACHANTLTNLIPSLYAALDVVSRELVGFIPAVNRDPRADRVAKNQTLYSHVAPANTLSDIAPAMTVTAAADQIIGSKSLTITNFKKTGFNWTGEETKALNSGGPGINVIQADQLEQCFRAITNQIETDLATAAAAGGSRAYGTSGTTPFASTVGDSAQAKKILDDNGAPGSGRSLVINTTAGAALRTLSNLSKANEAGTVMTLRDGQLLDLNGLSIKESGQVQTPAVGTGASYQINHGAGYAVGDTALTLDTGTGTILAGDILTIGNFKYVVASALAANVVTIAAPGLRAAVADNDTVTVNAASARNAFFSKNAILLGTRLPALPESGDLAIDRQLVMDKRSGIVYEVSLYLGYRMVMVEVAAAWGITVVKPEHLGILLG